MLSGNPFASHGPGSFGAASHRERASAEKMPRRGGPRLPWLLLAAVFGLWYIFSGDGGSQKAPRGWKWTGSSGAWLAFQRLASLLAFGFKEHRSTTNSCLL